MISFSGYGFFLVMIIYVVSFFGVSKVMPLDASRLMQVLSILATCGFATFINYVLAKQLNKRSTSHTVCRVKLEKVVLYLGGFFLLLALLMLMGELKN